MELLGICKMAVFCHVLHAFGSLHSHCALYTVHMNAIKQSMT